MDESQKHYVEGKKQDTWEYIVYEDLEQEKLIHSWKDHNSSFFWVWLLIEKGQVETF